MSDSERSYQAELSEEIDAGGCAETWEAVAERRSDESRRGFLGQVAATLAIGAGGTTAAAGTASAHDGSHSGGSGGDPEIETVELEGRERSELVERANNSDDVAFAADVFGKKPSVSEVVEYRIDDDVGRMVTFGSTAENGVVIKYNETDVDSQVTGGMPVGDGVRTVDAGNRVVHDIRTPTAQDAVAGVGAEQKIETDRGETARTDNAILIREFDGDRFDVFVPIVRDGEVVDRAGFQGTGAVEAPATVEFVPETEGIGKNDHEVCGPWGWVCTDYCTVICSAVAGLAGVACTSACAAAVATAPISPACGVICSAVVNGICYPTCTNLAH